MNIFSEALLMMDRGTEEYMWEEMKKENEKLCGENEKLYGENEKLKAELASLRKLLSENS